MLFGGKRKKIQVEGMHCEHCARKVKSCLENLTDVRKVKVRIPKKEVMVIYHHSLDNELLQKKIEELGYQVTGIRDVI